MKTDKKILKISIVEVENRGTASPYAIKAAAACTCTCTSTCTTCA